MILDTLRALWRPGGDDATLGRQMGGAAAWSSLGSITLRLGSFVVGIVAARLIAPEEFGVFAVALTVHAIILNISDLGVSAYIIRHDGDLDAVGPTVTTIAFASALALALAMALSAPWIAAELGSSAAVDPVRVLSLTVLLAGVSSVPGGLLTREFRQDKHFLANMANFLVSTAILLALALTGGGALALAWSRVAGQLASTVALFKASPKRYLPGLDRAVTGAVVSFGLPLIGSSFLGFLIGNIDYIVIGRILGAEPLGFYYLAYNVGSWPYVVMSPIVASVAVAAFSRVRRDRTQFGERMSTSMAAMLGLALPANALIIALAQPLIGTFYGSQWMPAATVLGLTAAYGALRVPADLFSNIAIAEGRTRPLFLCQVAYLAALAPMTAVGVHLWGITGAGVAHVAAIFLVLLPGFLLILGPSTGFGLRELLRVGARPLGAATVAGLAAHLLAAQIANPWGALLAGGLAGTAIYVALVASWGRGVIAAWRRLWSVRPDPQPAVAEGGIELVAPVGEGVRV